MKIGFIEASKMRFKTGQLFSVCFYNGHIDGAKFATENFNTSYGSFEPVFGAVYFTAVEEAIALADELNEKYPQGVIEQ